jgi:hypothetical protein
MAGVLAEDRSQVAFVADEHSVCPVRPWPGDLAAQDRYRTTENHDLGVLRRLAVAQQEQPAKDPDDGAIQKSDRYRPENFAGSSCRDRSNGRSPSRVTTITYAQERRLLTRHL